MATRGLESHAQWHVEARARCVPLVRGNLGRLRDRLVPDRRPPNRRPDRGFYGRRPRDARSARAVLAPLGGGRRATDERGRQGLARPLNPPTAASAVLPASPPMVVG